MILSIIKMITMTSQEDKIQDKQFLIKIYTSVLQIKKAIRSIMQNDNLHFQLSILGKPTPHYSNNGNGLNEMISDIKMQLSNTLGKRIQFGYFNNPKIGALFIAGHLTETFLHKVDGKELASLPVGLYGIFRGIGIQLDDIDSYLKELQNGKFLLLIRGEAEALTTIGNVL